MGQTVLSGCALLDSVSMFNSYTDNDPVDVPENLKFFMMLCGGKGKFGVYIDVEDGVQSARLKTDLQLVLSDVIAILELSRCDQALLNELRTKSQDCHLQTLVKGAARHTDVSIVRIKSGYCLILRTFDKRVQRKLTYEDFPFEF